MLRLLFGRRRPGVRESGTQPATYKIQAERLDARIRAGLRTNPAVTDRVIRELHAVVDRLDQKGGTTSGCPIGRLAEIETVSWRAKRRLLDEISRGAARRLPTYEQAAEILKKERVAA